MPEYKFPAGPWIEYPSQQTANSYCVFQSRGEVDQLPLIIVPANRRTAHQVEAIARLVTAAPLMLMALEGILPHLDDPDLRDAAETAIRSATKPIIPFRPRPDGHNMKRKP